MGAPGGMYGGGMGGGRGGGKKGYEEPECFATALADTESTWTIDATVTTEYETCKCDSAGFTATVCGSTTDGDAMTCIVPMGENTETNEDEYLASGTGELFGRCVVADAAHKTPAHRAEMCLKDDTYNANAEALPAVVVASTGDDCGCSADGTSDHAVCDNDLRCFSMSAGNGKLNGHYGDRVCGEGETCSCQDEDWTADPTDSPTTPPTLAPGSE